jgi:hypothetical protein
MSERERDTCFQKKREKERYFPETSEGGRE